MYVTKFYFDFSRGDALDPDEHGLDFEDAEKAYLEAYEAALQMWGDLLRRREDPRRCAFHVRDKDGNVLFVLPFREVLESCRDVSASAAPMAATYFRTVSVARRARELTVAFEKELQTTRAALREAARLIATPLPK